MFKRVLTANLGTRHERDLKRIQPILDAIHEHETRLATVSDDEVRAQTTKFRQLLTERTAPLEAAAADLREKKRSAADAAERDRLDNDLTGPDGSGGVEADLRRTIADTLDELLPEAFATVREAC